MTFPSASLNLDLPLAQGRRSRYPLYNDYYYLNKQFFPPLKFHSICRRPVVMLFEISTPEQGLGLVFSKIETAAASDGIFGGCRKKSP